MPSTDQLDIIEDVTRTDDGIELPTLYQRGKKGDIYSWRVWTEGDNVITEYGLVDGEKQKAPKACVGKNIGRSNETTPEEQAKLEAMSVWQNKRDRKYHRTPGDAQEVQIRPMLADTFEKRLGKNVSFPAHVQPKLDGVRALVFWQDGEIEVMSRSGKSYREIGSVEHIARAAEGLPEGYALDGEIYAHGESFQETTRLVKKYRPGSKGSERLVFHVYDVIRIGRPETPWSKRLNFLWDFGNQLLRAPSDFPIQIVETAVVQDVEQVYRFQAEYLRQGYEGAMVRLADGPYIWGKRSHDVLKVKTFQDAEFEIVGVRDGVGKFAGAAIFRCKTADGKEFDTTPKGTMEQRKQMFADGENLIGQQLRVTYFETTEDGIPRFPIADGVRLLEDM